MRDTSSARFFPSGVAGCDAFFVEPPRDPLERVTEPVPLENPPDGSRLVGIDLEAYAFDFGTAVCIAFG